MSQDPLPHEPAATQPNDVLVAATDLTREELLARVAELEAQVRAQDARFACIAEIGSALGSTFDLDELLHIVMEKITELMQAERSTLFLLDDNGDELWSKVTQGVRNTEIRLRVGEGIAGWVALTGKSLNIRDAYNDPRFNPAFDARTGFSTRSILCQPMRNQEGQIIGVAQVLNQRRGHFSDEDEMLLSLLASQAAIAVENSKLYLSVVQKNMELTEVAAELEHTIAELDTLYEVEKDINLAMSLERLIGSITLRTAAILQGSGASLALADDDSLHYFTQTRNDDGWRFTQKSMPLGSGVCGRVIEEGTAFLCNTGACDTVPGSARGMGVNIHNVVAVPLLADGKTIGALKVFNRDDRFDDDDLKLLTLVASRIAAAIIARSHHEQLEKSGRLASIGQMLSGVIHDLKNPIAVINGYVQFMVRSDDRTKREGYADIIYRQFDHINQMTRSSSISRVANATLCLARPRLRRGWRMFKHCSKRRCHGETWSSKWRSTTTAPLRSTMRSSHAPSSTSRATPLTRCPMGARLRYASGLMPQRISS
ncbi:MAG: GAF domain-containing protein [bacterium]